MTYVKYDNPIINGSNYIIVLGGIPENGGPAKTESMMSINSITGFKVCSVDKDSIDLQTGYAAKVVPSINNGALSMSVALLPSSKKIEWHSDVGWASFKITVETNGGSGFLSATRDFNIVLWHLTRYSEIPEFFNNHQYHKIMVSGIDTHISVPNAHGDMGTLKVNDGSQSIQWNDSLSAYVGVFDTPGSFIAASNTKVDSSRPDSRESDPTTDKYLLIYGSIHDTRKYTDQEHVIVVPGDATANRENITIHNVNQEGSAGRVFRENPSNGFSVGVGSVTDSSGSVHVYDVKMTSRGSATVKSHTDCPYYYFDEIAQKGMCKYDKDPPSCAHTRGIHEIFNATWTAYHNDTAIGTSKAALYNSTACPSTGWSSVDITGAHAELQYNGIPYAYSSKYTGVTYFQGEDKECIQVQEDESPVIEYYIPVDLYTKNVGSWANFGGTGRSGGSPAVISYDTLHGNYASGVITCAIYDDNPHILKGVSKLEHIGFLAHPIIKSQYDYAIALGGDGAVSGSSTSAGLRGTVSGYGTSSGPYGLAIQQRAQPVHAWAQLYTYRPRCSFIAPYTDKFSSVQHHMKINWVGDDGATPDMAAPATHGYKLTNIRVSGTLNHIGVSTPYSLLHKAPVASNHTNVGFETYYKHSVDIAVAPNARPPIAGGTGTLQIPPEPGGSAPYLLDAMEFNLDTPTVLRALSGVRIDPSISITSFEHTRISSGSCVKVSVSRVLEYDDVLYLNEYDYMNEEPRIIYICPKSSEDFYDVSNSDDIPEDYRESSDSSVVYTISRRVIASWSSHINCSCCGFKVVGNPDSSGIWSKEPIQVSDLPTGADTPWDTGDYSPSYRLDPSIVRNVLFAYSGASINLYLYKITETTVKTGMSTEKMQLEFVLSGLTNYDKDTKSPVTVKAVFIDKDDIIPHIPTNLIKKYTIDASYSYTIYEHYDYEEDDHHGIQDASITETNQVSCKGVKITHNMISHPGTYAPAPGVDIKEDDDGNIDEFNWCYTETTPDWSWSTTSDCAVVDNKRTNSSINAISIMSVYTNIINNGYIPGSHTGTFLGSDGKYTENIDIQRDVLLTAAYVPSVHYVLDNAGSEEICEIVDTQNPMDPYGFAILEGVGGAEWCVNYACRTIPTQNTITMSVDSKGSYTTSTDNDTGSYSATANTSSNLAQPDSTENLGMYSIPTGDFSTSYNYSWESQEQGRRVADVSVIRRVTDSIRYSITEDSDSPDDSASGSANDAPQTISLEFSDPVYEYETHSQISKTPIDISNSGDTAEAHIVSLYPFDAPIKKSGEYRGISSVFRVDHVGYIHRVLDDSIMDSAETGSTYDNICEYKRPTKDTMFTVGTQAYEKISRHKLKFSKDYFSMSGYSTSSSSYSSTTDTVIVTGIDDQIVYTPLCDRITDISVDDAIKGMNIVCSTPETRESPPFVDAGTSWVLYVKKITKGSTIEAEGAAYYDEPGVSGTRKLDFSGWPILELVGTSDVEDNYLDELYSKIVQEAEEEASEGPSGLSESMTEVEYIIIYLMDGINDAEKLINEAATVVDSGGEYLPDVSLISIDYVDECSCSASSGKYRYIGPIEEYQNRHK